MIDLVLIFFAISLILFFGYFALWLFKKTYFPDVLFLLGLGIVLGPHGLKLINPSLFEAIAPIFTTFTLLFLVFDGAFNIDLSSFVKGFSYALSVTFYNFIFSSLVAAGVFFFYFHDILLSLFGGFILGGVSSAFVMPVIEHLHLSRKTYAILALESAFTDVLCIGTALTMMDLIGIAELHLKPILAQIVTLFAVAGFIGIMGGIVWLFILKHFFREEKSYIMTIAFLLFVYVAAEFVGGNGAIAGLFFGLLLKNAKELSRLFLGIMRKKPSEEHILKVISTEEEFFYEQISFFLKTFFFVYVGLLLDIANLGYLLLGILFILLFFLIRKTSRMFLKHFPKQEQKIMTSIIARGLAAAVLVQFAVEKGIPYAESLSKIVYVVITFSILFSSLAIYWIKYHYLHMLEAKKPTS